VDAVAARPRHRIHDAADGIYLVDGGGDTVAGHVAGLRLLAIAVVVLGLYGDVVGLDIVGGHTVALQRGNHAGHRLGRLIARVFRFARRRVHAHLEHRLVGFDLGRAVAADGDPGLLRGHRQHRDARRAHAAD